MNELRFLEIMGKIDDDLIRGAMSDTKQKDSRIVTRRNICAFGSVAAAAVITVGSVAFYNAHKPSDLLADHSVIEQDNSHKDDGNPEHQGIHATTSSDKSEEHTTNNSAIASQTDKPQEDTKGTVTTPVKDTDAVESENAASKTDSQTQRPCDSSAPNTQQGTAQEHNQTDPPEDPTSANNYYQNFKATVDPYSDAYGEDELHLVSVIISGRYYYQLDTSEHPAHNISAVVSDSDFGEYVGRITELCEHDDSSKYTVSSQEPNLSGADVYYYAPADSSAVIIVKKGEQCSIFVFNGMTTATDENSAFAETFKVYGAYSADDIESISFTITVPNGAVYEVAQAGTITDRNRIASIVDILYQLKAENTSDSASATPQWVVDAWEACRADPSAYTMEDITFDIVFKNGTVLKDIIYQPFIGNGYIAGMQELTPEQNITLKELLR